MKIGARVTITGPPLTQTARTETGHVRQQLARGLTTMADTAVGYWRGSTPKITGRLRQSERATVTQDGATVKARFHVDPPGADYYVEVADKYPHLEDLQIVDKWTRENERTYIDAAIKRGLEQ